MPSVYIKTYGCQMNERDSEAVAAQLVAKGYTLAPSETVADVILLNTCSVRDLAEQKALGKWKTSPRKSAADRPNVVLGFMGCMAQSRGQELIDRLPDVDLVLGTQKFHRAADCLDEILAGRAEKIVDVAEEQGSEATIREHLLNGSAQEIRHRVCQHHAGLQPVLHVLHRALHARRGTQPDHSRHRGRVPPVGGARREGNHPARPDCDELWKTRIGAVESRAPGENRNPDTLNRRPSPTTEDPPSFNSSTPSTKSKDWNASGSPRRIRKVMATI